MDVETVRQLLWRSLRAIAGPGNRWRTLFILLLACNWKNLPLVWHYRFFSAVYMHSRKPRLPPQPRSSEEAYPLFLPVVTSTSSPVLECDYNIHKSNSTYFSDLDISRTHLVSLLCSPGLAGYRKRLAAGEETGRLGIALGGVACFFQREIKPYEKYELWTRVLCWDHKWVYIVTHFVKKGAVVPSSYVMQPNQRSWWPWKRNGKSQVPVSSDSEEKESAASKKDIFAFALSKYVFKSGRKTIPPELVFERCGQLPPRPADSPPESSVEDSGLVELTVSNGVPVSPESINDLLDSSLLASQGGAKEWTWDMVEKERQRGMKIAELMVGMDGLKEEFTGYSKPALGAYKDLLWV